MMSAARPLFNRERKSIGGLAMSHKCQQRSSFAAQTGPKATICFRELARPAPDMAPTRPPIR
jgi:hypothetical protein